jgi:hypothetical protein
MAILTKRKNISNSRKHIKKTSKNGLKQGKYGGGVKKFNVTLKGGANTKIPKIKAFFGQSPPKQRRPAIVPINPIIHSGRFRVLTETLVPTFSKQYYTTRFSKRFRKEGTKVTGKNFITYPNRNISTVEKRFQGIEPVAPNSRKTRRVRFNNQNTPETPQPNKSIEIVKSPTPQERFGFNEPEEKFEGFGNETSNLQL